MTAFSGVYEFSIFWFMTGFFMLIPHIVFTFFLQKRSHFVVRMVIGLLLCGVAAYLTCFINQWTERYYLLLHLAGVCYLAFCSKCSFKMIIYFNIWCVVLYYFTFQIHSLFNALLDAYSDPFVMFVSKSLHGIALVILSIVFIRSVLSNDIYNLPANQVVIAVLISVSVIAFNTITFASAGNSGYVIYILQIFSMLCNLLAMYLQIIAFYRQLKILETEYIRHMWRKSKRDHEVKSEYIDLLNHKYHDLKHELRALRTTDSVERKEYLDQLEQSINQFGNLFQTDNEVLDAILNDVRRYCEREQIAFSCIANCKDIDFIDIVDLSILLGNMMDNAVEATSRLAPENRVIDLKLLTDDFFFRITEKNTFSGELNITDKGLATTKPEPGYHGFGSQSMQLIVKKYNGKMALDAADGIFLVHVIIPIPASESNAQSESNTHPVKQAAAPG